MKFGGNSQFNFVIFWQQFKLSRVLACLQPKHIDTEYLVNVTPRIIFETLEVFCQGMIISIRLCHNTHINLSHFSQRLQSHLFGSTSTKA